MAETIDGLVIEIEGESTSATDALAKLEETLGRLKTIAKGGISGLNTSAKHIRNFNSAVSELNLESVKRIKEIAKPVENLKTAVKGGIPGLRTSANHIKLFQTMIDEVDLSNVNKLYAVTTPLLELKEIGNIKMTSTITQIGKLSDLAVSLENVDMDRFSGQISRFATALTPLSNEMNKIAAGFNALPRALQKAITKTNESTNAVKKNTSSWLKNALSIGAVIRVGNKIADLIELSNNYTENQNLFNVALGKYADEAKSYAAEVRDVMGVDPSEWMRNQGIFMTLATGFGVASERAYLMSKNLTQLGYDLSSFYNVSVEEAMQKLKSGFAGELEPLALAA